MNITRNPKTTPITEDYEISNTVLGLGINGKNNFSKETMVIEVAISEKNSLEYDQKKNYTDNLVKKTRKQCRSSRTQPQFDVAACSRSQDSDACDGWMRAYACLFLNYTKFNVK
ncbi:hypothetical protein EVAR_75280_1 [Eumeta japonica]|uniref:Uncharacterized protein n=1 Tax=Eumeta variegata TaxID=151549 RepID=A0A4C1V9X1_EUMVA|nr:hypothetical protein EVAR_75280_1 [Eumeta japonica]